LKIILVFLSYDPVGMCFEASTGRKLGGKFPC